MGEDLAPDLWQEMAGKGVGAVEDVLGADDATLRRYHVRVFGLRFG